MDTTEKILQQIQQIREERGLSINQISRDSGMLREQVSRILIGKNAPTLTTLDKILNAMELTMEVVPIKVVKKKPVPYLTLIAQGTPPADYTDTQFLREWRAADGKVAKEAVMSKYSTD